MPHTTVPWPPAPRAPAPASPNATTPPPRRTSQELGICESIAAVQQLADPARPKPKRKAPPAEPADPGAIRRSSRPKAEINYAKLVDAEREERAPREPVDYEERIKGLALDSEAAETLRAELEAKRRTAEERRTKGEGKKAGPKDSGKGVRVQVSATGVGHRLRMVLPGTSGLGGAEGG